MIRAAFTFFAIVILSVVMAGLYGILHDQVTYTISHEYYTEFKFIQFGLTEETAKVASPRYLVALTGWMATWWVGLIIGLTFGLIVLPVKDLKTRSLIAFRALAIVLKIAVISGGVGYIGGSLFITGKPEAYYIPDNLTSVSEFVTVGSIHNFSYAGAFIGMLAGIFYIEKIKSKFRRGRTIES